jgi:hypothetical protein
MIENWNNWNDGMQIEPSKEYGYQYIKATIDHVNAFKGAKITKDTCKFEAAREIYKAAYLIEHGKRDSAIYYPILKLAIRYFFLDDCESVMDLTRNAITNIKTIDRLNSDVDIYPNPANNRLYINLKDSKPASVQINNLNGQPLLLKQLNNQIETIDISKFAKGIYLIKIIKNNTIIVRKVVFQ